MFRGIASVQEYLKLPGEISLQMIFTLHERATELCCAPQLRFLLLQPVSKPLVVIVIVVWPALPGVRSSQRARVAAEIRPRW